MIHSDDMGHPRSLAETDARGITGAGAVDDVTVAKIKRRY